MLLDRDIRERLGPLPDGSAQPEDTTKPKKKAGRWLAGALTALALALWGAAFALILHFERISPHQPDREAGEIYRFSDHRSIVYLTAQHHALVNAALILLPLITLAAVLAVILTRERRPPAPAGS